MFYYYCILHTQEGLYSYFQITLQNSIRDIFLNETHVRTEVIVLIFMLQVDNKIYVICNLEGYLVV